MRMPQGIEELGVTSGADERAVKRAYAQRLKKIDQEADPEGFQHLRETYEAALRWVAERDAREASKANSSVAPDRSESMSPVGQGPDEPLSEAACPADTHVEGPSSAQQKEVHSSPPSPEQLASAVFNELMNTLPEWSNGLEDAIAALQRGMDDVRLINLDARGAFEWLIGRQLLEGWRPGHEVLFVAALEFFQWETDRSRLRAFGQVGATLDAALTERMAFHTQTEVVQTHYRALINQLRQDGHPGNSFLSHNLDQVELLVARLPNWLWIITKLENLNRWREWGKGVVRQSSQAATSSPASTGSSSQPAWPQFNMQGAFAVMLVLLLLKIGSSVFSQQSERNVMSTRAMEIEQERVIRLMREVQERERKPTPVESPQNPTPDKASSTEADARPALRDLKLTGQTYSMNLADDIKSSRTKSTQKPSSELNRAAAEVAQRLPQPGPGAANLERRTFNESLNRDVLGEQLPTLTPKP